MKRIILFIFISIVIISGFIFLSETMSQEIQEVESEEREAVAYIAQGDEYFQKKLYQKAINAYKMALEFKPFVYTYRLLGGAYYNIGDYENAAIAYQDAIDMSPDALILYSNLSKIYSTAGKYDQVIDVCNKGLKLRPEPVLLNNLADAYMNKGSYEKAIRLVERALSLDPDLVILSATYAEIHEKMENYPKALAEFEKIKDDPKLGSFARERISKIKELMQKRKP